MDKQKLERIQKLPIINEPPRNEKEEKWLREIVEYEFENKQDPGLKLKFTYGTTKQHEQIEIWCNEPTPLPRFIARYLQSKGNSIYKYQPDGRGNMIPQFQGRDSRFVLREVYKGI